jgi:hypothetical protein
MARRASSKIIGLIRFSFPATDGFAQRLSPQALYASARLEPRFAAFETLTLPSLLAQSDGDFRLGVLVGEDLPAAALTRLRAALAPLKQAEILIRPPGPNYEVTHAAFDTLARQGSPAPSLTSFRLDDDDAVDRDFIARLRARVRGLLPLVNGAPFAIAGNRGFWLRLGGDALIVEAVRERLPLGIGLALTATWPGGPTIYRRNHRLLPQFFTTFSEVDTPSFLRLVHSGSDSEAHASGTRRELTAAEAEAALRPHFPFSMDDLQKLALSFPPPPA